MNGGAVWLDASCTAGTVTVSGIGILTNDGSIVVDQHCLVDGSGSLTVEQDAQLMKTLTAAKFMALK
jgi:hypothetical protein